MRLIIKSMILINLHFWAYLSIRVLDDKLITQYVLSTKDIGKIERCFSHNRFFQTCTIGVIKNCW